MKIKEEFVDGEGSTFHVKKTYDLAPAIEQNALLRSNDMGRMGESVLIGTLPGWLLAEWMKEAGVCPSDTAARDEILKRKMLDGEFAKLRVWEGTY